MNYKKKSTNPKKKIYGIFEFLNFTRNFVLSPQNFRFWTQNFVLSTQISFFQPDTSCF
jgi:hypothetical protein